MKTLLNARQLTVRYFSIVAVAITVVHCSVYELTTDDLEYVFVQNRLDKVHEFIQSEINKNNMTTTENINVLTQGKAAFDTLPSMLFDLSDLPEYFPDPDMLSYNKAMAVYKNSSPHEYYIMKVKIHIKRQKKDALIVIDNALYELSEEQLASVHTKQIAITITLTLISLLVVIHMSKKLTMPIAIFSKTLSSQNPADLNILSLPREAHTKELNDMVCTFNHYQSQIQQLIERERSFNQYASHELRSPLMVMKGAITLLGESDDKVFSNRQIQRLEKAAEEMSEFVETLLSLTKHDPNEEKSETIINEKLLHKIVENHIHLLQNKDVSWKINISGLPRIRMPEAAFHILLGNLVKNAFAYTVDGEVIIEATTHQLQVIDAGQGLKTEKTEGYGLGLLLVRDISRRFGHTFELADKFPQGTVARLIFAPKN